MKCLETRSTLTTLLATGRSLLNNSIMGCNEFINSNFVPNDGLTYSGLELICANDKTKSNSATSALN